MKKTRCWGEKTFLLGENVFFFKPAARQKIFFRMFLEKKKNVLFDKKTFFDKKNICNSFSLDHLTA